MQAESPILSLDTDGRMIVGGCQDGSIRIWMMNNGTMVQIHFFNKAHTGGVTAITLGRMIEDHSLNTVSQQPSSPAANLAALAEIMISGSDDCSIRVWRIWYDL
jgi:WD40 repeat protein